jgi:S-adenosylmethionine/arginine decarboxylase-like enzyme
MQLEHWHWICTAKLINPPANIRDINARIKKLVRAIDMKILDGPHTVYCDTVGNKGYTSVAVIETSHIAMHIWNEQSPAIVQLDVYSCQKFSKQQVLEWLAEFNPIQIEMFYLDRKDTIKPSVF